MLMKPEKKDAVQVIMGKLMKKEDGNHEMETEPAEMSEDEGLADNSVDLETAAEELIQAMEMKSPKAMVQALKSLIEMLDE